MDMKTRPSVVGGVNTPQVHDSGHKHVTGLAEYADDITEPAGTLHAYIGLSQVAHGEIVELDLSEVLASPGVVETSSAVASSVSDLTAVIGLRGAPRP